MGSGPAAEARDFKAMSFETTVLRKGVEETPARTVVCTTHTHTTEGPWHTTKMLDNLQAIRPISQAFRI